MRKHIKARAECPPPAVFEGSAPVDGPDADRELAGLAKGLGHPTRVRILRILLSKEACVCGDIVDELPVAQSTVSEHLRILKASGLVRGEVDGPRVAYCIDPAVLRRLRVLIGAL